MSELVARNSLAVLMSLFTLINLFVFYEIESIFFHIDGCHIKLHREHFDKKEEAIAPCKLNYDPNCAKELLLLASTTDEQKHWVTRLSKKIQKSGYKANTTIDGARVSPRESTRSLLKPYISTQQKSATLPANATSK